MGVLAVNGGTPTRTKPFHKWPVFDEREALALKEVVESGQWWGRVKGSKVEQFEEAFARYQHSKHCIACTNGTIALYLSLKAVGVKPGEEVIVPPYTFIASASSVLDVGAVPVFADIDPETMTLDPKAVEAAITPRTSAIMAVHIAGRPCDMDSLTEIARKHGLVLIEDAAQAHGASWKGRRVGAIGGAGGFSFQASKNITAGEGGAVTTDSDEIAEKVWSLHNCGRSRIGEWYAHYIIGGNHRMTEWQAAVLLVQLQRADELHKKRQQNANYLNSLLRELEVVEPLKDDSRITEHAYHLFIFRYFPERMGNVSKARFIEALRAEGIPVSPGYKPLYREPAFNKSSLDWHPYARHYDYSKVKCPATERVCDHEAIWLKQEIFLGETEDMGDIAQAIKKVRDNYRELL
ncbi:MAG: DegT/DnrJ/EryC1/StrS family aminotransferase [Candidatus Fervidibacter sp.]|uniref:DegT/DnrJ/EryC1/StrS family aminotransferase n=1 Tax=Candidatus Fervidibacter sp. TaxID=3100871 RepID=UPI0040492D74